MSMTCSCDINEETLFLRIVFFFFTMKYAYSSLQDVSDVTKLLLGFEIIQGRVHFCLKEKFYRTRIVKSLNLCFYKCNAVK